MNVNDAAKAMYDAFDILSATEPGTDEYVEARINYADAEYAYDMAYKRKMNQYPVK